MLLLTFQPLLASRYYCTSLPRMLATVLFILAPITLAFLLLLVFVASVSDIAGVLLYPFLQYFVDMPAVTGFLALAGVLPHVASLSDVLAFLICWQLCCYGIPAIAGCLLLVLNVSNAYKRKF